MKRNPVVSPREWLATRRALLAREKEAIRLRHAIDAKARSYGSGPAAA